VTVISPNIRQNERLLQMASPASDAADPSQSLTYEPLSTDRSIRLFELETAQEYDDPIVGSVSEYSLDHLDRKYFALSYVWGDDSDLVTAHNSEQPSTELAITRNLDAALRQLRDICKPLGSNLILWVDSLCIDQGNLEEKSLQIPLMCDIYQNAESVFVWLGKENQYADYQGMFEYLCILFNEVKGDLDEYEKLREEQEDKAPPLEEFYPKLDPTSSQAIAFGDFFRNTPWFHRAWTMQESVVAQSKMFLCGGHRLPDPFRLMPSLYELASRFEALDSGNTKWIRHCIPVPKLLTTMSFNWTKYATDGRKPLSFVQCLDAQRGAGCKDARDIVYSVLGLVQDPKFDRTKVVPDYQKPLAVVYAEAFAEIIRSDQSIHALSLIDCRVNTSIDYGLPSWVPDWKTSTNGGILSYSAAKDADYHFEAATSSGPPVLKISQDFRELMIAGISITKIESVVDKKLRCAYATVQWDEGTDRKSNVAEALRKISGDADAKVLLRKDEATGRRVFHLAKGGLPDGSSNKENVVAHNLLAAILAGGGEEAFRYWPIDEEQEMIDHSTTDQLMAVYLPSVGRLAHTESGSLAIVNETTKSGDVIIVPLGGQVPLVLRPQEDKYIFVGECFLSGYMHGEALSPLEKESDVDEAMAHLDIKDTSALNVTHSSEPGSPLAHETALNPDMIEDWIPIVEETKGWVPAKDPINGEWFTLV
jgi:hypothetical protein